MEYTVIFSLDAQNDLKEISDYIERETYSIDMSNKVIGEIVTGAYILQIFPYMYQKVYKEFHCLTIKNNRIFYEVDELRKQVIIYHILSGFQDYKNYM